MNFCLVFQTISWLIALEGVAVCLCSGVACAMHDSQSDILKLLFCGCITIAAGLLGIFFSRKASGQPGLREGFAVVTFGWLLISIFGALPFSVVVGMKWYDAVFETVSGFTTTGASVISEELQLRSGYEPLSNGIESLSSGILFWRALTHWIGGMGIVVFSLAFLPIFAKGGQALYNAEVPGVKTRSDQFTPRIASTAKILLLVYCGLTFAETFLLHFFGMTLFDAVCHSFATISTGGFSTKKASIAAFTFNSHKIQLIIIVFMFLAGCNFILLFRALNGLPLKDYINEEFRTFFLILLGSSLVIAGYLFFSDIIEPGTGILYHLNIKDSLLAAVFQVVSISTTTGFSTGNYVIWPPVAGMIIFTLMLMGGCGGSTSGGIKCMRMILFWKFSLSELRRNIFPHSMQNIRLNGDRMTVPTINKVLGFLMIYMLTALVFMLLFTVFRDGCDDKHKMDLLEAISASVTCISNVGPGFGKLGPDQSFYWVSAPAKLLMALEMLIGRLELYTVMIFFLPSFWKK